MPWLLYPDKDPVAIVHEAGWTPGPVWMGAENLAPHQDSIPGMSSPLQVTTPTSLSQPSFYIHNNFKQNCITDTKRNVCLL